MASFDRAKCGISPVTQLESVPSATGRVSILPRESLVTSNGSARNRTFTIISARQQRFCEAKESYTKCSDENFRRDRFQRAGSQLRAERFSVEIGRASCRERV